MITNQIKNRYTNAILFECGGSLTPRKMVEEAVRAKVCLHEADLHSAKLVGAVLGSANLSAANLAGAELRGAYLCGANLSTAYLCGADLSAAYLVGADLSGADCYSANLSGANLTNANLRATDLKSACLLGAHLEGAYLRVARLVGERPFLQIGPIGSRRDSLQVFLTDKGVLVSTGCFREKTLDEFRAAISDHQTPIYQRHHDDYEAALLYIEAHAKIWMPEPLTQTTE